MGASNAPTWDDLLAEVRSGSGSEARHEVGAWAMKRVRAALGEDWPKRWHERFGGLPQFVADAARNALAYTQLLETGLRLETLASTVRLRRLSKEWSSHLEQIRLLHVLLQLEVAALARWRGSAVEFEAPILLPASSRPADVVIGMGTDKLITECFCIYNDQHTAESIAYDRELGFRLHMMAIDLRISGHWDVRLPRSETAQLLAEVERTAAQVLADGTPRDVARPGIEFRLARWTDPQESEIILEGPATLAVGWPRARAIINGKAKDWAGSPVPVWLRVDLLDGTWLFSDWAQRALPDKTDWMAALVAEALADTDIAGVIVSRGSYIDAAPDDEEHVGPGGIVGLRRRLDPLRIRETIIVPLSPDGANNARFWRNLYDAEPGWLRDALASASLSDIEAGWSRPN